MFRVFAPLYASLARCSASAERFALSSTLQPFGPSTAHFASLRVLGASAASRPPISHRTRLWRCGVPRLRTALRFACAVFRVCGALRAVLDASALRAFDCALRFAPCPRGFSRFAASDFAPPCANACAVFRAFAQPSPSAGCVPPLRTSLRSVSSGLQPLRGLRLRTSLRSVSSGLQPLRGLRLRTAHCASLRVLATSAASRPPISRCARRSSAHRLPCARGAVGASRLRGCRLRGCRFHRFRFGLRPSGINQCARIIFRYIHDISSAPYALRPGARLVHQDPHRLSLPRPALRGQTLRPPPARRLRSSDTDSRSGSWLRTVP